MEESKDVENAEEAKTWHVRGVEFAKANQLADAANCFEHAVQLDTENANYRYNLGLAYRNLNRPDDAIAAYRAAIERKPDFVEAHHNLGIALTQNGDAAETIAYFREFVVRFPNSSIGQYNLGNMLGEAGELEDSVAHFRRAIELDPDFSAARENLGRALVDAKRFDEAAAVWKLWLEREPDNAVARHMLASATGKDTPRRCTDQYVRATFDSDFAKTYEQQLANIQNKGPSLIAQAIELFTPPPVDCVILDGGCGTGLCAPSLRPFARHLVGVDLSGDMLNQARERMLYDELVEEELTQYLNAHPSCFDLFVSGDTLCYFGDLADVCAAMWQCLRVGGRIVFTLELYKSPTRNEPFQLQPNGRFRHAEAYVRETLAEAGFTILDATTAPLRMECGQQVEGLVMTGQRQ